MLVRKGRPELDAIESPRVIARRLLGMRDPAPRRHDVYSPGTQHRFVAEAVVVNDFALEEPGDGLQPDVRVRRHIHRLAFVERQRAKAVEEAPRAHEAPILDRQRARNRQCAKVDVTSRIGVELTFDSAKRDALLGGDGF